jgi:hypothetical protein
MINTYAVDQDKWSKLDIFNQMGNIYSEIGRSFKSTSDEDRDMAVARAIDLFDATALSLSKTKSPKLKEVLRAKEEFLNIMSNKALPQAGMQSLDKYFMQFAVAARLHSVHDL